MARTNLTMREPLREYIHEYKATTPRYDKQGHQIFPTYYLQDSERLMPVYRVKAIGRGQPQNFMHQQVVAGDDYQRLNRNAECFAKCTTMTHQQNQPQNGTNCAYTASGQQLPLNLSMPLATCDRCAIDHLFVQCPLRLTMPQATCDRCAIDHLFAQCPNKSPKVQFTTPVNMLNSQEVVCEKSQRIPNLNAITRLQAKATPVIEAKDAQDDNTTKTIKRRPKKKKSKKGTKKIVGTKGDPVTIKEINEDSDDSSLSECAQNLPKVARKQASKEPKKTVEKQIAKEPPKVVNTPIPRAPPQKKTKTNKPGIYSIPRELNETEKRSDTKDAENPSPQPIPNPRTPSTILPKPPQVQRVQVPNETLGHAEEEHNAQFERWCKDMLENTRAQYGPNAELWEHELQDVHLRDTHESKVTSHELGNDFNDQGHDLCDMPFPPDTPSEGRSVVAAQLNAPKLMNFLAMPTTTTMLIRLKGDPELAETLRSFLNDELAVNLESLQEAPIENWPSQEPLKEPALDPLPEDKNHKEEDPKSLFRLRVNTLGDYFEGEDSNAVLPIVCKGNTVMAILDGGAGVSIVTKHCWEKMGRPPMEVADLRVKLANGSLVNALGLLKNFKVKVLDHYVRHTFAVMDFDDKPSSYEMILGRPFMREHQMVHDWSNNQVYLTLDEENVRVDLKSGKAHPMTHGFFRENSDTTVFSDSEPTTSINYCKELQKDMDLGILDNTNDHGQLHELDWNHLLATIDVWGKRGITCVNAEGVPLPPYAPLCMFSIFNSNNTCNPQEETAGNSFALTQLKKERKLETSLAKQKENRPQAKGQTHDVLICETNEATYISPLRTQIEVQGTHGKVLYNALLDTGASHNLLSFNAWNQLGRPALTQSILKVRGVNGNISHIIGTLSTVIHCANGHLEGSFWVMPAGELPENVLLGRTWMAATQCNINWATNKVNMVIPSCPTGSHCMHCSPLQKLTLLEGPTELASQKPNPKLTTNAITTNTLPTQKAAPVHSTTTKWLPRQKQVFQWVPKTGPQRRKKPRRKKRPKKCNFSTRWVLTNLLREQGYFEGNCWIWIPKSILLPQSTRPRIEQPATMLPQDTRKSSSRWVPKNFLQAQGYYEGNPWIWLPKNFKHKTSTMQEAVILPQEKGKQVVHELPPFTTNSVTFDSPSTYECGESSCKSMESSGQPSSIISPRSSSTEILTPQQSNDNREVMIPSVLPPYQPNKAVGNHEPLPNSEDFDEVVDQVNQAKDFLESKIKASSNWFIRWTSPALETLLPSQHLL